MNVFTPLVLLFWASTALVAAPASSRQLPRSAPEAQGVSSGAVLGFIEAAEKKIDALHSFMLVRHGAVVAEGWWAPYTASDRHEMYSLSKSFTSTAVGLAIADGKLSIEDRVANFFPEEMPEKPSANLRAMRVRDLLTMSTGHHNEDIQGFPYGSEESVVKKFLALPVSHKPGTFFVYNTPASYMLSAIVQKVTGQSVLEYLRPRLFEPLGIENPIWDASKQGVSLGGFGLSIRTEDIARFGQLYLQRGRWNGKQILPAAWVDTATSRWMSNGSAPQSDWEQGYGFQFWRCRNGAFRGDGAHGQFCVVLPELDAVIAITAGTRDLQGVLNVVWDHLLPALQSGALTGNPAAHTQLQQKLKTLSLPMPAAVERPSIAGGVAGARYVFPKNAQKIESITLNPSLSDPTRNEAKVTIGGVEQSLATASGAWLRSDASSTAVRGGWSAVDTFTFQVVRYLTPFTTQYRMRFAGDEVTLEVAPNVGAGSATPAKIVGRRE